MKGIWKYTVHDPIWGEIPRYRFPILAWLVHECGYLLHRLKIGAAHALRRSRLS